MMSGSGASTCGAEYGQAVTSRFTEVTTTNDLGNYLQVLAGMNDSLGPFYRYESGTSMAAADVSGTLALMQGGSAISQDLPPYTMARGDNGICGLNTVGLRRAGLTPAERLELKQVYRELFRAGQKLRSAVESARAKFTSAPAKVMLDFLAGSKRGVCRDTGVDLSFDEPRDSG